MSLEEQECYRARVRLFLLLSVDNHLPFTHQSKGAAHTWLAHNCSWPWLTWLRGRSPQEHSHSPWSGRHHRVSVCPTSPQPSLGESFQKTTCVGRKRKQQEKLWILILSWNKQKHHSSGNKILSMHCPKCKVHFVSKSISCLFQIRW